MTKYRKSPYRTIILRLCSWFLIFGICFGPAATPASATVTITYFNATWLNDDVLVAWETSVEIDNDGFYVQRSDTQFGAYSRISTLIPSIGDPQSGATYQFVDSTAVTGLTYWYKLEAIEVNGNGEYYGPVSAIPYLQSPTPTSTGTLENTPTSTVTGTSTSTPTGTVSPVASVSPTVTGTQAQSLPTATIGSGTAYPAPATATPPASLPTSLPLQTGQPAQPTSPLLATSSILSTPGAISGTAVLSPTATLIPLPDITLTFPPGGIVLQGKGTTASAPVPAQQSSSTPGWNPYGGIMLLSVIAVIWVLLGVWFYLSFRRIE